MHPKVLFIIACLISLCQLASAQGETQNPNTAAMAAWRTLGNGSTNPNVNFLGTTDNVALRIRTNNQERATVDNIGRVGIGTMSPLNRLHVAGDTRIGALTSGPSGTLPDWGSSLYFSGGPAGNGYDSDNTDFFSISRYNIADDISDLRVTVGDNPGPNVLDYFSLGTANSAYNLFVVRSDGNVGIGTRDADSKLDVHGKVTVSRDGTVECCGNNASIAIAENTQSSGLRASISFHNGGFAEGTLELTNTVTGVGDYPRRLRMYDNQGALMGLQLTGNLYYGNSDSRTQWRDNAGLQGNAGAQSGFYETYNPSNYPSGATSWWHLIDVRHNNPANNYAMQFAGSFFDQKLYMRKTNNNASTSWNRIVNSADASNTNGYLMFDVAGVNGTVEGSVTVVITNGTLYAYGYNEGGTLLGTWYQLNNVANAKVVLHITNDDVGNCSSPARVSTTRTYYVTNNGGGVNQSTDMGCSGSDGNVMVFHIAFNPL